MGKAVNIGTGACDMGFLASVYPFAPASCSILLPSYQWLPFASGVRSMSLRLFRILVHYFSCIPPSSFVLVFVTLVL